MLRGGVLGGIAAAPLARARPKEAAQASVSYDFNQHWLFGGQYVSGSEQPGYDDSWGDWDPATWEDVWIYRKHFGGEKLGGGRVLVTFDGAMVNATVWINGTMVLPYPRPTYTKGDLYHAGGYLPWSVELTGLINDGSDNVLAVKLDSTWLQVPPEGAPAGATAVDYLQPGGIPGMSPCVRAGAGTTSTTW